MSDTPAPNCAETCVQGCILGDDCPHLVHLEAARKYITETPWEQMMRTAETYTAPSNPSLPPLPPLT
ncbi:hypothetical protein [Anthocerotibacter panamensis]|uniref:hypothetical protein n=1 Tax=Anthocerotibacter panamensis TaxID=2857077 RepID=UPI001C405FC9|nr:hypothetical protein [Anthocerotibacter panamensis]